MVVVVVVVVVVVLVVVAAAACAGDAPGFAAGVGAVPLPMRHAVLFQVAAR